MRPRKRRGRSVKMSAFTERLKRVIKVRHTSGTKIEKALGLSKGEMSRMVRGERGDRVQYSMVSRLAHHLRVSVEWLGDGVGMPPREEDALADQFPARAKAIGIWCEADRSAHAIERIMHDPVPPDAKVHQTLYWLEELQYAERRPPIAAPESPPAQSHARKRAITPPLGRLSSPQKK